MSSVKLCVCQCVLSLQEVMPAGPIYTQNRLSRSLPPSLSFSSSMSPSLPPSLHLFQGQSPSVKLLVLYFPVLCSFPAVQNEFTYGKYTVHAMWKSLVRPAVYSCYKLSRLYLVLDRPPCYYNYHQHQKGYLGKLYLALPPPHFPLSAVSL